MMFPKIAFWSCVFICLAFPGLPLSGKNVWPANALGADECLFFNEQKFREIRQRIDNEPYAGEILKKIKSSLDEVAKPNPGFDQSWLDWQFSRDAALYYRITGDEQYLKKAVQQIVSGFQLNKPEKRLFPDTIRQNTYFWSWIMYRGGLFFAYDLIKTHPLFKPYATTMNQRLDEVITEGFRYKNDIVRLGNTQFWGITGLGIAGFLRKNTSAIHEAIEGEYGFKAVLEKFRDGGRFWPEPTLYSFGYVDCCLTILAEATMLNNAGNLYKYVASNGASLPKMIESYAMIAYPDGQMITNGDNSESIQRINNRNFFTSPELFALNEDSMRPLHKMEIYNYRLKTPFTAWVISQNRNRQVKDFEFWGYTALYYGADISKPSPFQMSDYVFPEMGNAIIRSSGGQQYWGSNALTVHFRNGASQQFHSHNDHFHFTLNARGSNRYHDWYYRWDYLAPRKSNGFRNKTPFSASILNHNTVVVDFKEPDKSIIKYAQDNTEIPGVAFSGITESNGMKIIRAKGEIYRGVKQTRTLGITADFVLDVFELNSDSVHNYDYVLHTPGKLSWKNPYSWVPYEKINHEYNLAKIDEKSVSPDNIWISESRKVTTNESIEAEITFEDGLMMSSYVLPEQNTTLIDARVPVKIDGEGWDQSVSTYSNFFLLRKPMIVVRRRACSTKFIVLHCIGNQHERPSVDKINSLVEILLQSDSFPEHPRLFFLQGEEDALKLKIATDDRLQGVHDLILAESRRMIDLPLLTRNQVGRRILHTSREAIRRITFLAYAHRMTGEKGFVDRAKAEMFNVAAFENWNPTHFLDVAEMTMAVAIGYDWLYDKLSREERTRLEAAIRVLGIEPSTETRYNKWLKNTNNWNQVCNGGISAGAVATFESNRAGNAAILNRAISSVPLAMHEYSDHGGYPEGYHYWDYGTSYNLLLLDMLTQNTGSDSGLKSQRGFLETGIFMQQIEGNVINTGKNQIAGPLCFNYADCSEETTVNPAMFWFASETGNTSLLYRELQKLETGLQFRPEKLCANRFLPMLLLWSRKVDFSKVTVPERNMYVANGKTEIAIMRSSWTDNSGIYVGVKAGTPSASHQHMDVGSFIMEANGVRWAMDFGLQEYNSLESKGVDLWNRTQNSQRWDVFRYRNSSHNTLTINNNRQLVAGNATIEKLSDTPVKMAVRMDLTSLYAGDVRKMTRTISLCNRQFVQIDDQFNNGDNPTSVRWNLLTKAIPEIINDSTLVLKMNNESLTIAASGMAGIKTFIESTESSNDFDASNKGTIFTGFLFDLPAGASQKVTVKLIPKKK